MNKALKILVFFCLFFIVDIDVFAASSFPKLSISNNDYELVCTYSDATVLTISKYSAFLINTSLNQYSGNNPNTEIYLTDSQKNEYDSEGNIIKYNHTKLLYKNGCPLQLYGFKLQTDEIITGYDDDGDEETEPIYTYYYSTTEDAAEQAINIDEWYPGGDWEKHVATKVNLVSEEAYLTTTEVTTICDYETAKTEATSTTTSASIYLYENITFLEMGGRITPLSQVLKECPQSSSEQILNVKPYIYINDPSPKTVAGNANDLRYDSVRFQFYSSPSKCKLNNGGNSCVKLQYIGTRNGSGDLDSGLVCKVLGSKTVEEIKKIIDILQIVVPALVIVLICFDITKMVLSGNIDEELPKKKKIIIIRLVVLLIFLFAPTLTELIIQLLNESGVIHIGEVECILE